jgi:predicted transcriptional regulator
MPRSRLESYENILEALVNKPLSLRDLAIETHIDHAVLGQHLKSLGKNELVEERTAERTTLYAITEKGLAVIKTLDFQKYLRRIKGAIGAVDEALEIISEIPDQGYDVKKSSE